MELLNLDEIVKEKKQIKLNDTLIEVDGELDMKTLLTLTKYMQNLQSGDVSYFEKMLKLIHTEVLQGLIDFTEFKKSMTISKLLPMVTYLFGVDKKGEVVVSKKKPMPN